MPALFRRRHLRRKPAIALLAAVLTLGGFAVIPGHRHAALAAAVVAPQPTQDSGISCHRAGCVSHHPRRRGARPKPSTATWLMPQVGADIAISTQTCAGTRHRTTPTTAAQCTTWVGSGPINIVVVFAGGDPEQLLLSSRGPRWRPAQGGHLVARALLGQGAAGCAPGWTASREQAELRLTRTDRRHVKLFHAGCTGSSAGVVFADAHTDNFDVRHCGGDHMTDLDAARDAVVRSLASVPGATVQYRQDEPAGGVYPGGCGQAVVSDGRVAYIMLP